MKIDIHVHVTEKEGQKLNGEEIINPQEMIKSMNKRGIYKSILMSSSEKEEDLMSNYELRKIVEKYPERYGYMCNIDLDKEDKIEERIKEEKALGALGIGELTYNKEIDSEKLFLLFDACQKNKMPVLFHISPQIGKYYGVYDEQGLPRLEKALKKFPQLIFIGHSQPFWFEISKNKENLTIEERNEYPKVKVEEGRLSYLLRKYKNLYCDLSANSGGNALMRDKEFGIKFIKEFQDRLMFGTDIYQKDQYFPLMDYLNKLLEEKEITKEIYNKIFYKNAQEILNI